VTVAVGETRLIAAASGFSSGGAEVFACIRAEDVLVFKTAEPVSASARKPPSRNREIPYPRRTDVAHRDRLRIPANGAVNPLSV
jgi:hypothetical protein